MVAVAVGDGVLVAVGSLVGLAGSAVAVGGISVTCGPQAVKEINIRIANPAKGINRAVRLNFISRFLSVIAINYNNFAPGAHTPLAGQQASSVGLIRRVSGLNGYKREPLETRPI
jgi:hypothetical protein